MLPSVKTKWISAKMTMTPSKEDLFQELSSRIKEFREFEEVERDALIAGYSTKRGERSKDLHPDVITVFDSELIERLKQEISQGHWDLEIGFGKGMFLLDYAGQHPDRNIVGIEVRRSFCNRVMNRVEKRQLMNVRVALGDARELIPLLFEKESLERVFLLFPDPWWKRRHAKRRYGAKFFYTLAEILKPGGLLVIKSDVKEYADHLFKQALITDRFEEARIQMDLPFTNRERRLVQVNLPVFSAVLQKI